MNVPGMKWYSVKLVYQIESSGAVKTEFDIQWRLIMADDYLWAVEKAGTLGRLGESTLVQADQQKVYWKFVGVAEIQPLTTIEDGVVLASETEEPTDDQQYRQMIRRRHERLRADACTVINLN